MPLSLRDFCSLAFSAATSARCLRAAPSMCLASRARNSSGRRSQARRLARNQKPSHMWLVIEQYFCTSESLAVSMTASGVSCPSTTLVCKAEYTSAKLIEAGDESKALNSEVHIGETGTRILKPLRSSALWMGLPDEVIWRNPLSQICYITTRPDLQISLRTWQPRSPPSAFQTLP